MKLRPLFKTHGGKFFLKDWIINHFPKNYSQLKYIEGCSGGCSVLLNKNKSIIEIANDADPCIFNIIKELINNPIEFIESIRITKYSEEIFEWSKKNNGPLSELIRRRFSRGGLRETFSWSNRFRGGQYGEVNSWETFKNQLSYIANRLKNVEVKCMSILDMFPIYDDHDVLWYIDPPYLPITRKSKNAYTIEMSEKDHINLSQLLNKSKGKILLSGYQSDLYAKIYQGWNLDCRVIANHSGQSKIKQKRIECIWKNY